MQHYVTYCAQKRMSESTLRQFLEILEEAFPPHERRVRDGQIALMNDPRYRIWTLQRDGKILGMMAVWMLEGMIFLEHFAVDASSRSGGIGGRMLDDLRREAAENGKQLILEVEMPMDEMTKRRVAFYRRHDMMLNEYLYHQMPLREGDVPVEMRLMSSSVLSQTEFYALQKEIYRNVYGIEEV